MQTLQSDGERIHWVWKENKWTKKTFFWARLRIDLSKREMHCLYKFKIDLSKASCFSSPAIVSYPLETVTAVTSAFCRGDAECSILHLLFSGSLCVGSRRTSLRSYHRRPTSINYCLYDTAPVAFVHLFSTLPPRLRNLKRGWRQSMSYKCFSKSNISTMPTVSIH